MTKIYDDENTPIEGYKIRDGKEIVYVKRDDLFLASKQPMVPALAKLRGARVVLKNMKESGIKKIACFDTRISKSGQGIAYLCQELKMTFVAGFPQLKSMTKLNEPQQRAKEMGAIIWGVQPGRTAVCYAAFKREAELRGYTVLPLGITFKETAIEIAKIAEKEAQEYRTVVVSTGTSTIATGIAMGTNSEVYGISCGMNIKRQMDRSLKIRGNIPGNLHFVFTEYDYYEALDTSSCPFPTSPYYDMKAWTWMLKNWEDLEKPVLFWNIGV